MARRSMPRIGLAAMSVSARDPIHAQRHLAPPQPVEAAPANTPPSTPARAAPPTKEASTSCPLPSLPRTPTLGRPGTRKSKPGEKALYRIPEAMRLLSLSRSVIYSQIRTGRLRSVKEGSARLIPAEAITEYVALLEAEAEANR